jgi:hypothetical protein
MNSTGAKQLQNVPTGKTVLCCVILHTLWNASTDTDVLCIQRTMLNISQKCLASTQALATLITCSITNHCTGQTHTHTYVRVTSRK